MSDFLKHVCDLYAKGDSFSSLFDFFKNNVKKIIILFLLSNN